MKYGQQRCSHGFWLIGWASSGLCNGYLWQLVSTPHLAAALCYFNGNHLAGIQPISLFILLAAIRVTVSFTLLPARPGSYQSSSPGISMEPMPHQSLNHCISVQGVILSLRPHGRADLNPRCQVDLWRGS